MHIRTLPYYNYFSRVQALRAKEVFDGFVFITENEFKCEKCEKTFNRSNKLILHINSCGKKAIYI